MRGILLIMQYTEFFKQIRNRELSGAYLLYGPEQLIQDSAIEQITETAEPATKDLNVQIFSKPAISDIIAACETLPFFAEKRFVLCRGIGEGDSGELAKYIPTMPDCAALVLCYSSKPDARTALWKTLHSADRTVECGPLSESEMGRWVMQRARKIGVVIEPDQARELVSMAGNSLLELSNELQKAADYVGPGEVITSQVLHACVTFHPEFQIFDMLEHFLAGRKSHGLIALHGMLRDRSANALEVASFIAGRLKLMLTAKLLLQSGCREQEAIRRMGGNPYAAKKALQAARRFSADQLRDAAMAFSDVDYLQKAGLNKDLDALEQALLRHF